MKSVTIIVLCCLLIGCAGHMTVMVSQKDLPISTESTLANVNVNDLRTPGVASSKREAAFGVPMGNIAFDPPEARLVKNVLESELTLLLKQKGIQVKREYTCDLLEFGVNTNTTPVYWDVIGRIRLVLKVDGKEYSLSGNETERTFVWPGETISKNVIVSSLKQVISDLKKIAPEVL